MRGLRARWILLTGCLLGLSAMASAQSLTWYAAPLLASAPPSAGDHTAAYPVSWKTFTPKVGLDQKRVGLCSASLALGGHGQAVTACGSETHRTAEPSPRNQPCPGCLPTFKDFRYTVNRPSARVLPPGAVSQCAICQVPRLQPPGSQAAVPSAGAGEPLTAPKLFAEDILHDQGRIWKFPWSVTRGRHWKPTLALIIATAGLVELDPHDTPYFRRTQSFAGFNDSFSSLHTGLGEGLFPVALFLAGHLHHDAYAEKTALLAGEALADAQILSEVMKNADRRLRPSEIPPNGDFAHTWFKAGGGILVNRGSFPSGHAIGAFAMATIVAQRYGRHRWVPWVAYGLASLVGFSRITLQAHFPSDAFAGAVLGYAISHFVVLRGRPQAD